MEGKDEEQNLVKVSENDAVLRTPSEDIRGHVVVDINGDQMGRVVDLHADPETREVRLLQIDTEEFLPGRSLRFTVPMEAVIDATDDGVQLDRDREQIVGSPKLDTEPGPGL